MKNDETVFIIEIKIVSNRSFWLEYHSATESRMIEENRTSRRGMITEIITKHKGNIYFSQSSPFNYTITYVNLK